jgi:hypothetical protein
MKTLKANDLGKKFIVEECQKIEISKFLGIAKIGIKEALLKIELENENINIKLLTSLTHKNGLRYWFGCPICSKRIGVLFVHPISNILGCRNCLDLRYKKSRFKGMVENN